MKKIAFLTCLLSLVVFPVFASETPLSADAYYDAAEYEKAAEIYRQVVAEAPGSAGFWYNLGNAYYKSGRIGFAVASYRKAHKLDPTDEDILFNLNFVFQKTADRIEPTPKSFIVRQTDIVANLFTADAWALCATLLALLGLGEFLVYIFVKNYRVKKIGLIVSGIFWLQAFTCVALAAHRYYYALDSYAVIVAPSADVLGEPTENGTRLLILSEGATLKFKKHEAGWIKVELPNGTQGFVPAEKMEVI